MTLRSVHVDFSWVVVVANAIAASWAVGAHYDGRLRRRGLWWATIAAEATVFLQVGLGVALVALQDFEVAQFHAFYGFVAMATVGIMYSYRHQLRAHLYLLYGLGGLFLMGLCLRSISLNPIPR
jgi:hypothetical protein